MRDSSSPLSSPSSSPMNDSTTNTGAGDPSSSHSTVHGAAPRHEAQYDVNGRPLTKAGIPRKKPGRKPGSTVKPRDPAAPDAPKIRKPRKSKDPDAPSVQKKRKIPPTVAAGPSDDKLAAAAAAGASINSFASEPPHQSRISDVSDASHVTSRPVLISNVMSHAPRSMQNILNADPEPAQDHPPARSVGQSFDPIRNSYDPVRGTMVPLGSPRSTAPPNRASASPSIASLVDGPVPARHSPVLNFNANPTSHVPARPGPPSMPTSPSHPMRIVAGATLSPTQGTTATPGASAATTKDSTPVPAETQPPVPIITTNLPTQASPTTPSNTASSKSPASPRDGATQELSNTTIKPSSKPVVQSAEQKKQAPALPAVPTLKPEPFQPKPNSAIESLKKNSKPSSITSSSPNLRGVKDALPSLPDSSNPLDFGKAAPGSEQESVSIVLHIPLNGETNKYVNFMQMAEERYGWDALHPRAAAHRDRKARIAAAASALAQSGSGRESGEEMSEDVSDGEASGVGGLTSGAEAKPAKKKRTFKEDEYDKDDDFVDDSEMLWEEQAAASRDGFFVYSGPLVPEDTKPPTYVLRIYIFFYFFLFSF